MQFQDRAMQEIQNIRTVLKAVIESIGATAQASDSATAGAGDMLLRSIDEGVTLGAMKSRIFKLIHGTAHRPSETGSKDSSDESGIELF